MSVCVFEWVCLLQRGVLSVTGCACVRACVRACVAGCACVRDWMCVRARMRACVTGCVCAQNAYAVHPHFEGNLSFTNLPAFCVCVCVRACAGRAWQQRGMQHGLGCTCACA